MMNYDQLPIKIDVKVDSKDARRFLTKLIDTITRPFAWWAQFKEPVLQAKADVEATLIRAKSVDHLAEVLGIPKEEVVGLLFRSSQREQYQKIRQQKNIETIVQRSVDFLPSSISDKPVDEDWVSEFFEQCKNVSNEQMQSLWSKILAGEVAEPGTFYKRTLALVRILSRYEAEMFTKFCSLLWFAPKIGLCHIRTVNTKDLDKYGIDYANLVDLDSIGLITISDSNIFFDAPTSVPAIEYYGDRYYLYATRQKGEIRIPIYKLTSLGMNLAPISGARKNEDYKFEAISTLKKWKVFVSEKPPRGKKIK